MSLGTHLQEFIDCVRFIDGTLIKIHKPWQNEAHCTWFNGQKNIYVMNNMVIVDHHGLFIYVDQGYPSSYHDVSIL